LKADTDALPADRHVRFSEQLSEEYFRQLAAETWNPKDGWTKQYDRNEALDCFVLALAAAMHQSVQVHRLRELDWQRLEQLYEPVTGAAAKPEQKRELHLSGRSFMPTPATIKGR
jgi:phage terminase large subunit GpA-like protein